MRRHRRWWLAVATILIGVSGCATGEEWATWKQHPTHFASGDHLSFSMRNREGSAALYRSRWPPLPGRSRAWYGAGRADSP